MRLNSNRNIRGEHMRGESPGVVLKYCCMFSGKKDPLHLFVDVGREQRRSEERGARCCL